MKRSFAIHSLTGSSPENTTVLLVEVDFFGLRRPASGIVRLKRFFDEAVRALSYIYTYM